MKKSLIARDLTLKLYAAEHAVDASVTEMSELIAEMLKARRDMGLAACVGAEAVTKAGEALSALLVARNAAVVAHAELKMVQDQLRIPVMITPEPKLGALVPDNDSVAA